MRIGPLSPVSLHAAPDPAGGVRVTWTGTGEAGIVMYRVYRQEQDADPLPIGSVNATGDNRGKYEVRDSTAKSPGRYTYYISAVDRSGTEGQLSAPSTITLGP